MDSAQKEVDIVISMGIGGFKRILDKFMEEWLFATVTENLYIQACRSLWVLVLGSYISYIASRATGLLVFGTTTN